ncbi:rod shape-determining protein MreC [Kytococcus sedentarius]|uniref:Cell shape-determining protein MreC n=1 Tax=Kytococcus sedentarius (strain ATCC 14392 / DSM 20547 / JCM 11482 / CCUG 33030 / NBRC 15357 / NCTC 11040 / CCM 314 / 541) TaxID=478801 RepID=C7NFW7_KYTSD|nr:rod shape-determining protein MreC [Kytococcus sedentarius]ACV05967.1 cell shape-determining protein [Kytococcus sedentarius DSM 20547]QQB64350.1 rod shape-determining protein MreC [Kytococcus sedentarius]STX12614.1 rod shape-determining protein MreC [Kytococcus sedentarius]
MADRIRPHGGSQPVRGRRRGDSQRRVPVGVVRREGLTGRRLGMQQRDRSAERKAWLGPLLAVAVTVGAVGVDTVAPVVLNPVRDAAEVAFAPLQRAMVVPPTEELQAVETERDQLADALHAQREKQSLDSAAAGLFDSEVTDGRELVPARVIGFTAATATSPDRRITIDVGRRDGVETDLTVVSADGLVGRVISVTDWTSEVMVLGDPQLSTGVRAESGAMGVLSSSAPPGTPQRTGTDLTLRAFEAGTFSEGDVLTTLGGPSSPFVDGVPVGEITAVDADQGQLQETAVVEPAVQVSTLEVVGVLSVAEREESRQTVTIPSGGSGGTDASSDDSSGDDQDSSGDPTDEESGGDQGSGQESGPLDGNPDDDESVLVTPDSTESVASDAPTDAAEPDAGGASDDPAAPPAPTDSLVPDPTVTEGGN